MSSTASSTASTTTPSTLSKRAEFLLKIAMVIIGPLEFQVLDESYSTVPQEALTTKAIKSNIPVLDLLPTYRQACQKKSGDPCHLEERYLFADVWMHPSAYGHELTATEIKAFLDELLE